MLMKTTGLINLKEYALPSKQPKIVHIYPNLFLMEKNTEAD
jgi:hypothetical protein